MKKILFLFTSLFILGWGAKAQNFIHPGGLHTNEDFERIKQQIADGNPRVIAGYNALKANPYSSSTVITYPVETIIRGVSGENYINAGRGAAMAYQNALRWKISGDVAHAERAILTLNRWANENKDLTGNTNMSLASGLYGYEFANAAELMSDYEGWAPEDKKKVQQWLLKVFYPKAIDFLKRRHDTWSRGKPGHYWSNWGLCNALAVMSIGIFCDDVFLYNQGVQYYKYDLVGTFGDQILPPAYIENHGLNEFLGNLVPVIHQDARGPYGYLGQMQESGRDQGHTVMALGLAVDICQVAWNQGDDLFAYMDNRLAAGIEYVAAYNTGVDSLPWTNYWYQDVNGGDYWRQTGPNESSRGHWRPFWERIIGHYQGIKGIDLPYAKNFRNIIGTDWGGSGSTSGNYDHLGFSTLTCVRDSVGANAAPTSLGTKIQYNGTVYNRGELSGVTAGSTIKLMPSLPGGETSTGNWQWTTGATTQDLEITINNSTIYRVTYTNSKGVKSTQMFSIAVYGDCTPDYLEPYIAFDGVTVSDTIVTIVPNTTVTLTVWAQPGAAEGAYLWDNGNTTNNITIENVNEDVIRSVTFVNEGGALSKQDFYIKVATISPTLSVNNAEVVRTNKAYVLNGDNVEFIPNIKPSKSGGTWTWSDGSTSKDLLLQNVQTTQHRTLTYTVDGEVYTLDFHAYVLPFAEAWSYWPLNEGNGTEAQDQWSGRHATVNGASWINGVEGNAVQLNGTSSSFVEVEDEDGFINNLTDFTVALWVKRTGHGNWARIWDFGRGTNNYMFLTSNVGAESSEVRFAIKNGGSEQQISTSYALDKNQWIHIAVTKSGKTGIIYINGIETGRNTDITINPSDLGAFTQNYFGKSQFSADAYFNGVLDDIRIYNIGLPASEIADIVSEYTIDAPAISVTVTDGQPVLSWDAVGSATGYTVKRSRESGKAYTTIAPDVTSTTYTDGAVQSGGYYYVVSALKNDVPSAASNEVYVVLTPDTPTDVLALSWNGQIDLKWEPAAAATGYKVKRATTSGGAYQDAGTTSRTVTSFSDKGLTNGTNYYYVIVAINDGGESEPSTEVSAAPTNIADYGDWKHAGIGNTGLQGIAGFDENDVLTIYGAGADIYDVSDSFHFLYQAVTGNVGIVTKVETLQNTHADAKSGIMIRSGLENGAANVRVNLNPGGSIEYGYRLTDNASTSQSSLLANIPQWVKLVRRSNVYTAYYSADGMDWTEHSATPVTVDLGNSAYVGLLALSHNKNVLTKATYGDVYVAKRAPSTISSELTATGNLGSPFSYTIVANNSPYYYRASGLPDGLSINHMTGKISGTPTSTGTFTVFLTAGNAMGEKDATLTLTINEQSSVDTPAAVNLKVYPNPVKNTLSVLFEQEYQQRDITMMDIKGQILLNEKVSGNVWNYDAEHLSAGVYFLKISENENIRIEKIIKQ